MNRKNIDSYTTYLMVKIVKITFFIFTTSFSISSLGQIVKSKDGVSLGQRSNFINSCIRSADQGMINMDGFKIEAYKYCSCVCDNLLPTIYSWEMEKAFKENMMKELIMEDKNFKIIMKCLESNFQLDGDYKFGGTSNPEIEIEMGIKSCVNEIIKGENREFLWTKDLAEKYCECAVSKLVLNGYTYHDVQNIEDENSLSFNEIAIPCLSEVLKEKKTYNSVNRYDINDIMGGSYISRIPLIDYFGKGYKIKITIDGISKYYLFDTGASDLIIDNDTERELLLNGFLKRENYLSKTQYTLANNQKVNAQKVKVDNIVIGDYTLNNVIIAVIDEGSLLCGKSFLDKFKKWEIDEEKKHLLLYK